MLAPLQTAGSRRGAGIAEAIMAIVVSSLLLSVIPAFYMTSVKLWQRETGRLGAVEQADAVLHRMQDDIRNARRATLSSDGTVLTIVQPGQAYDASLARQVNVLDAQGQLTDGDQLHYYFVQDPEGTGSSGGAIYRRVVHANGTYEPPRLVATRVYPHLNPRAPGGSTPAPPFSYDGTLRKVAITITTAEPKPSSGTFAPRQSEPMCRHCGGNLMRVPTTEHLEGEIQCAHCGAQVEPTAEIVTYQTRLRVRNQ